MRTSVGGLGANHRGLRAQERRFRALVGGLRAGERASLDGAGVGDIGLLAGGEGDRRAGFIQRFLLTIATFLSMIECLLADVAADLFAIDFGLAVVKDRGLASIWGAAVSALLVMADLFVVDASLLAVASELLPVAECLFEFGEALLFGELAGAGLLLSV